MTRAERMLAPFRRIADALADPLRANATALAALAAYVVVWWVYALIAKSSQDIHFDMGEAVSWSLVPAYGYPKHPPFPAWAATVWFAVFPYADWAYYLLAMVSVGVGLWFAWLIGVRYVDGHKRALVLTLLMFSPGFNFQPLKFNSNSILIPVWAAAAYFFLRSFSERTLLMGVIAGLCAAFAMLSKYWSVFLILGFIVAALAHPKRWDYLRSPASWAAVAVGTIAFAPNVVVLFDYNFQPFRYASAVHDVHGLRGVIASLGNYFGGVLYLVGGFAAVLLACRPGVAGLADMAVPREADRRMLAIATWTALLAPVVLALALHTRLATLWTMPMWAMLPALLMSSQRLQVSRDAAAAVLLAAVAFPLLAVLAAPIAAIVIHRDGLDNHAARYRLIAEAVEKAWRERTQAPLKLFGSDTTIVNGAGFYLTGRPLRIDIVGPRDTPWVENVDIARDGMALVCPEGNDQCRRALDWYAGLLNTNRMVVTVSRSYLGMPGESASYLIAIRPPR